SESTFSSSTRPCVSGAKPCLDWPMDPVPQWLDPVQFPALAARTRAVSPALDRGYFRPSALFFRASHRRSEPPQDTPATSHLANSVFNRSTVWRHFGVVGWQTVF